MTWMEAIAEMSQRGLLVELCGLLGSKRGTFGMYKGNCTQEPARFVVRVMRVIRVIQWFIRIV